MATDNPTWGYTRIRGGLKHLGHDVARNTIEAILKDHGCVRYVVLFVMKLKTRPVEIPGITRQPDANWMTQVARNLTDAEDRFLRGVHYLILDRDPLYTVAFRDRLRDSGVTPVRLEFVVRPRLGAGPGPGSGRPNAHG
jgi:putative transposase